MPVICLRVEFHEDRHADMPEILRDLEREMIEEALLEGGSVKSRAARMLGINRTTLVEKMRKYDIPLKRPHRKRRL